MNPHDERPVLVFGIGNSLRGDDGIGTRIVELMRMRSPREGVELIACNQLLPEHAPDVARASKVVFIDAAAAGTPGTVSCAPVQPRGASCGITHQLDPAALLASAHDWFGRAPAAFVVTVAGLDFAHPEELSAPVAEAIPEILRTVGSLLPRATMVR